MEYAQNFIDKMLKEIDTPTVKGAVGLKNDFNIVVIVLEKEWNLEDDSKVLFGIKKTGLKIDIFVHIFKGSHFPKLSEINQKDLPLEIYDNANSIMVGLKREEVFMTQAARDLNSKGTKLFYRKSIKETEKLVEELMSSMR